MMYKKLFFMVLILPNFILCMDRSLRRLPYKPIKEKREAPKVVATKESAQPKPPQERPSFRSTYGTFD